jgi:protein-S-isoprenylcysteine O-methyltransferase Ste14
MSKRIASFLYGAACYAVFLATFLYAIGFIGNLLVPRSIDVPPQTPLAVALFIDTLLLGVFAIQHSVMARQWFKRGMTKMISPAIERSTYVLLSSLALVLLFWKWQPIEGTVWSVENYTGRVLIYAAYAFGWLTVLVSTFLINHVDLFGLRQVWFYLRGRQYQPLGFRTPGPYAYVRHPLYVGWLFVFWSTPIMTSAHLLFAVATTTYILIAIQFEEHDLRSFHNEYVDYARRVPMLIPTFTRRQPQARRTVSHAGGRG